MENKQTTSKFALQYGVLFGIIIIVEFVLGYVLDIDPIANKAYGIVINLLNYLILPSVLIYVACNSYKITINSGFISFSECLKIGVTICVLAGLISSIFAAGFMYILPEYVEDVIRKTRSVMLESNPEMTSEQAEMGLSMVKKFMNPVFSIPITVVMFSLVGLVFGMIVGAICKKEPLQSF
jgi:hypothetical protein